MRPSAENIVANAGPLIALAKVQALPLLHAVFAQTMVTETVLGECLSLPDRPDGAEISAAVAGGSLVVIPDSAAGSAWGLDPGEASAIAAALARGASILMDDRAGRRVANELGVPVIGVLSVLILAKRRGELPAVRPLVDRLIASGYYLADAVIEDAFRLAREAAD